MTVAEAQSRLTYLDNFELGRTPSAWIPCRDPSLRQLDNARMMFLNGINTTLEEALSHVSYLSKLAGNVAVDLIYNAHQSFGRDVHEARRNLDFYATPPTRALHMAWTDFFSNNPSGLILQICHSQGAIHVFNALLDYPEYLRDQIRVVAIAPAAYVWPELCESVMHYKTPIYRDPVPYIDNGGRRRCAGVTRTVRSHPTARRHDHSFQSRTYRAPLRDEIGDFFDLLVHR